MTSIQSKRPWFLGSTYQPSHNENRMNNEGNVPEARKAFYAGTNKNLIFLLNNRFQWMQQYIDTENGEGVELGCGQGYGKDVLKAKTYLLTDYNNYDWLDVKMVDALDTPFDDEQFDFVIASNMIHHVPFPPKFFAEVSRILKPGGKLLVQDVNASLLMRVMLHVMRIEGYSYNVDVFDDSTAVNDPSDLWSGNNVVPNLLFDNTQTFHARMPGFRIIEQGFSETLVYLASGGVTAKTLYIPLPNAVLSFLKIIDNALCAVAPQIFALQRRAVLEKTP